MKKIKIFCFVFLISSMLAVILYYRHTQTLESAFADLYKVPKDYSIEQARKDGIADTSVIKNGNDKKIDSFLRNVSAYKKAHLKTVCMVNGELVVRLYFTDNYRQAISLEEYYPKSQSAIVYAFNLKPTVKKQKGVCEVWLTPVPESLTSDIDTFSKEHLLYSYYEATGN